MTDSYAISGFYERAAIPCAHNMSCVAEGTCALNVDGKPIRGGTKIAGTSGYGLSSMGMPAHACAAFPLFAAGNRQYMQMGWQVTTNRNPLTLGTPQI